MMRPFLLALTGDPIASNTVDLCLDYPLVRGLHSEKFREVQGLDLFPDLEVFSASMQALVDVSGLKAAPLLRELDLSLNEIADVSVLAQLPLLRRLNVSHNEIETIEDLRFPPALEDLDIGFNQIRELAALENASNLKRLVVSGNRGLSHLEGLPESLLELHAAQCFLETCSALATLPRLETLTIGPGSMRGLEVLSGMPRLAHLQIHAGRMVGLIDLPPMPHLRSLRLHKPTQVPAIGGWDGLPELRQLSVSHSALRKLPSFSGNSHLEQLEIQFCPLENLDGLADLPALRRLVLHQTAVSGRAIADLKSARPNMEVIH